jgi:hypothetical protein
LTYRFVQFFEKVFLFCMSFTARATNHKTCWFRTACRTSHCPAYAKPLF